MGLFLELKSLSVIGQLEVGLGNCLVTGGDLNMVLAEHANVPVKRLEEAVNSSLIVVKVLVHQAKVEVDR